MALPPQLVFGKKITSISGFEIHTIKPVAEPPEPSYGNKSTSQGKSPEPGFTLMPLPSQQPMSVISVAPSRDVKDISLVIQQHEA